ncbi:MAG: uroporphyrinogen-III synthase [Pseudomonadota bacterium]
MAAQSRAIPIVLTRPAEQGARFAVELHDRFGDAIRVIQSPLLAPRYLQPHISGGAWTAVIFTSATAVAAFEQIWPSAGVLPRKAYCVGDRTAKAARDAGFAAVSAKGDAAALSALVLGARESGPLLHLRGQDTVGNIARQLVLAGIETDEAIVYAEVPQNLSEEARTALAATAPVILPVFSPRTAMILTRELTGARLVAPVFAVAFSPAVADALGAAGTAGLFVARRPDAPSMLAAIGEALIAAQVA